MQRCQLLILNGPFVSDQVSYQVVDRALTSLQRKSHEITLTVPLNIFNFFFQNNLYQREGRIHKLPKLFCLGSKSAPPYLLRSHFNPSSYSLHWSNSSLRIHRTGWSSDDFAKGARLSRKFLRRFLYIFHNYDVIV